MRKVKLVLEYDGTNYVGWQQQAQPNSIQQVLAAAIHGVMSEDVSLIAAGRTDAGVHALGQVVHFNAATSIPAEKLVHALNAHLPPDIVVREAADVPDDFHARFGAKSKIYRYTLATGPVRPALDRAFCWHVSYSLDRDRLRETAALLVGEHDFAAFGAENFRRKSTVRTLYEVRVEEKPERLFVYFHGNGFLYNMVRSLVGTLVEVGRGKMTPAQVATLLEKPDRAAAGPTAPPQGLCLMRVFYDESAKGTKA